MTVELGPHSLWTKWLEVSVNSSLSAVLLQRAKSVRSKKLVTVCLLSNDVSADFYAKLCTEQLIAVVDVCHSIWQSCTVFLEHVH
jgi:hypothetical protein